MNTSPEHDRRIAQLTISAVFPLYLNKIEKKGRTKEELLQVIEWLTGFNSTQLDAFIHKNTSFEDFFKEARLHPNAGLITGMICGYRIEEIQTELTRNVRYLDKLVDELAKGRKLEKILRD